MRLRSRCIDGALDREGPLHRSSETASPDWLSPLLARDSSRVVGKPEVMARIGSAGITSGLPVIRPEFGPRSESYWPDNSGYPRKPRRQDFLQLLQSRILCRGLFQEGDIGIGTLQEGEELLISSTRFSDITLQCVGAGEA